MILFDRLLSVVLALVLLVVGVLVPVEVVHTLLGKKGHLLVAYDPLTRFSTGHAWNTSIMLSISIVVAVLGLLLLLLELKRRRPAILTVRPITDGVVSGMSRSSLGRAAANQATHVEGVSHARAVVRRRSLVVQATTGSPDAGDLDDRVRAALSSWLDGLGLVRPLKLRTRLATGRS